MAGGPDNGWAFLTGQSEWEAGPSFPEAGGWPDNGCPTQARFWLEWERSALPNSVIPTEADHRECDDLRSGGTLCCDAWRPTQRVFCDE